MAVKNLHVRKDDMVVVISGKDKGKKGKILKSIPSEDRVVVEGVNVVLRHTKPRGQGKRGGRLKQEAAINASNVMALCPKCHKAARVGHEIDNAGKKHRTCKKCGARLD
ncbi:MAG: 50S ribosomal protein L24 [Bacillota bacterium]|nr:50S ribosomal protein L24 [Bacillota bacterium]